ncbi:MULTISPECIES: histidine phosphatase family protein [Aeromicrobium]|uniref:histidine phosphatase family protein n=1 Tax=Aeromicrobium TaxID=2040 RepID=UPI0025795CEE|nr:MULTISPECIES: histidine phosphatase family protein [Aeromicrobium]
MIRWMRHGESTWNAEGRLQHRNPTPPLTELGRSQARQAAEELRGTTVDVVLSSPALRARQTASVVADVLRLDVVVDDRLVEMDHAETVAQVRQRVLSLVGEHPGELLAVSHGDTIAVAVELLTGDPCSVPANGQIHVTGTP